MVITCKRCGKKEERRCWAKWCFACGEVKHAKRMKKTNTKLKKHHPGRNTYKTGYAAMILAYNK